MRGPQPPAVTLSDAQRQALDALVRQHRTPQQVAVRARIILAAATGQNNTQIARQHSVDIATVRLWRTRWLGLASILSSDLSVAERLEDAPRPGGPCRISTAQVCRIIALACEAPASSNRPISQWTGREIADEAIRRGIVATISPRHAARLLKRGICSPIVSAIG